MNYKNITNHSKEKMSDVIPASNNSNPRDYSGEEEEAEDSNSTLIPYRDIKINTEVLNVTLFYADWCGHCKRFMGETWGKLKEKYGSNKDVQLNQIDCTNVKSSIETPAGKSIEGFPSVILNYKDKDGKYVEEEYNGPRSADVMSSIIDKFCGSSTPNK
jgi:thiol-disulfide isomerase/thioredoxin